MSYDPRYPQQPYHPPGQPNPYGSPGGQPFNYYGASPQFGYHAPPTHSGVGIASFIIGCVVGLIVLVIVVIAGAMSVNAPGGELDENDPKTMVLGCSILLGALGNLVGLILGFISLAQRDRKKLFGILGLVFNGGMVLFVVGLMILGSVM